MRLPGRRYVRWCVPVLLAAVLNLQAQDVGTAASSSFQLRADWRIDVYAARPLSEHPESIDVDTRGRVWICEGPPPSNSSNVHASGCLKVLEDTDGDGRADKATVFAEGLRSPMRVRVAGTRVYLAESNTLWIYDDVDGDLRADAGSRRSILTGFGSTTGPNRNASGSNGVSGQNTGGISALAIGPDHRLYLAVGLPGIAMAGPDSSGRQGTLLRCELDGTHMEVIAVELHDPRGLAIDSFGEIWCNDHDNAGSSRLCWVMEGGSHGWQGTTFSAVDAKVGACTKPSGGPSGRRCVPPAFIAPSRMPGGLIFYEYDLFGPACQDSLLHANPGAGELSLLRRQSAGAGFVAQQTTAVSSGGIAFEPIDVSVAPDGALFIAVAYPGGSGHDAETLAGGVYRISPRGVAFRRSDTPGPYLDHGAAMNALGSPNPATQFLVRERLLSEGAKAVHSLAKVARTAEPHIAARSLWLLNRIVQEGSGPLPEAEAAIDAVLQSERAEFRSLGVRLLRDRRPVPLKRILPLASDADPAVRREVLLGFRSPDTSASRPSVLDPAIVSALQELERRGGGGDIVYQEAIRVAFAACGLQPPAAAESFGSSGVRAKKNGR